MEKRGPIDHRKIMVVTLLIMVAAATMYFTALKGEKGKVFAAQPQPEIPKAVIWYTSLAEDAARKLANAFELEYKNTIRVQVVRNSSAEITERLLDEIQNQNETADVFHVADVGIFLELKEEGNLLEYHSPEYVFYPQKYKDEGFWVAMRVNAIGMAYDSNRITDPPESWIDLMDSRWKGKIALKNVLTSGTAYGEYYMLRELYGVEFWEKIANQDPIIYKKYSQIADALLSGEVGIAMEFAAYKAYEYSVKKGTAIRWINPSDGVPMVPAPVAILKDAEHPEEAKLLLDFLLSEKGQNLTQRLLGTYSVRSDIEALEAKTSLGDLNQLLPESWEQYEDKKEALRAEFGELFEFEG